LTLRDRDLLSIQEARSLVSAAAAAQKKFAAFSQEQVDAVVDACAAAAASAAEALARMAVEETGFGNVADKVTKNRLAAVDLHRAIRPLRTVGILNEDREKRIVEVATPVGVVAAVIPSTNPTSTAIYKTLIALKARNGIVLSPHPSAARCICATAEILRHAATGAGAPDGLVGCILHSTLQGTQELMRHRETGVILATGGTGLVRAAYGSGKPAYGVGPGNVPAYIERTADVPKAVADIIAGKTFDYGTICSSEQAIIAEKPVAEQALEECRRQGAYFLSADEAARLGELVISRPAFTPNPQIVGRPATMIAEMTGIRVPPETRVLIARLDAVGREHPLSAEKLSPILAFYVAEDTDAAIELATRLLQFGGLGHTISIHSRDDAVIRRFGQAVPAFRVCVNTSAVHGSIGYSTNLFPAMTLGCGAPGGNITSDNIGPLHLVNVKRIAWESRAVEHRTVPADRRLEAAVPAASPAKSAAAAAGAGASPPDRGVIRGIVERVFSERGIPRGAGLPKSPSAAGEAAAAVAASVASGIAGRAPGEAAGGASFAEAPPSASATSGPANPPAAAEPPAIEIAAFVSESDVRGAMARREKIFIGPKTIVTPSARDLASAHEVLVETGRAAN
jgi:acetaldehyde dehydrogenase (acetylating)